MSAGRRVAGTFFRVLTPRWAHAPLSGEGSARQGGRFNRPRVPALYLSRDLATAWAEYQQTGALIRPGTVVAYDIAADGIADLTDTGTLLTLGVAVAELHCAWRHIARIEGREPPTWRLADRLLAAGMNGLLAPSAVHAAGANLVLWRWGDAAPVRVRTQDPQEDLPRDQPSWPRG